MRRIAAACAALSLLTLPGCFYPQPHTERRAASSQPERYASDAELAQNALLCFVNAISTKNTDVYLRFTDIEFLSEASGGDTEKLMEELTNEGWSQYYDTEGLEKIPKGRHIEDIQDKLSILKGSASYPEIDLSRITDAYSFSIDGQGVVYVLKIDGEWKTDLALVNIAEMMSYDQ